MQIDNRHPAIEKWHVMYALKSVDVHGFVLNPFKNLGATRVYRPSV